MYRYFTLVQLFFVTICKMVCPMLLDHFLFYPVCLSCL